MLCCQILQSLLHPNENNVKCSFLVGLGRLCGREMGKASSARANGIVFHVLSFPLVTLLFTIILFFGAFTVCQSVRQSPSQPLTKLARRRATRLKMRKKHEMFLSACKQGRKLAGTYQVERLKQATAPPSSISSSQLRQVLKSIVHHEFRQSPRHHAAQVSLSFNREMIIKRIVKLGIWN